MSDEHLCDHPKCLQAATAFLAVKIVDTMAAGYFACDLHQAEGFWQVTKVGLRQLQRFDVVLVDADAVDVVFGS